MKCYFCQTELQRDPIRPGTIKWPRYEVCKTCKKHGVDVHNSLSEGELQYVHIYIDERTIIPIPGFLKFQQAHIVSGHHYHIRLHLQEGYTNISDDSNFDSIDLLKVPGFKINPANAKEKLKLYLLFS